MATELDIAPLVGQDGHANGHAIALHKVLQLLRQQECNLLQLQCIIAHDILSLWNKRKKGEMATKIARTSRTTVRVRITYMERRARAGLVH